MAHPNPDYSPAMLRAFLHARSIYRADMDGLTVPRAWHAECRALKLSSGVLIKDLNLAFKGRLLSGAKRTRIWKALGVYPEVFGALLRDDGGQE